MKTKNNYTQKEVIKRAYSYLFSYDFLLLNRKPRLDMRFNFSKDVYTLINELKGLIDKKQILYLRKKRSLSKPVAFSNVLNNAIVKDFRANKSDIKFIDKDVIRFYGRNHWAKNDFDRKILAVLAK